ncbi:AfsA-related hotdog domain-containing protein [Rhodococcus sp. G-MC3]|uniref:AfsA-related hotdog domain-containing protein n=1 Tax=Rhodococcus sp. G-MC3 TaxID=3046209 RepID=UPI0024B95FB9|nr:AfsA-related hotdog domain-containing protein [Rhodococcus sp. G-MC3]MDJ0396227.1 AfsA-related hotdog domain-containing protein [Rhodococcus sp. G-MC3]
MSLVDASDMIVEQRPLTDHSSIDRRLVHRSALSEVFLTDAVAEDSLTYIVAAQLPPSHAYFTDHLSRRGGIDPLLLLECCRQAETYVSHRYLDVPLGYNFILASWSMSFENLHYRNRIEQCVSLRLSVHAEVPRYIAGQLRSVTFRIEISTATAVRLGTVTMKVKYTSKEVYRALRESRRGSAPKMNTELPGARHGVVEAVTVGRLSAQNVVLSDLRHTPNGIKAQVRPAFDNPSFFDHPQDHVPAMVTVEAVRQLALLALADECGLSAMHTQVSAIEGTFYDYIELDTTAELTVAELTTRVDTDHPGALFRSRLHVDVEQESKTMCRLVMELITARGSITPAAMTA